MAQCHRSFTMWNQAASPARPRRANGIQQPVDSRCSGPLADGATQGSPLSLSFSLQNLTLVSAATVASCRTLVSSFLPALSLKSIVVFLFLVTPSRRRCRSQQCLMFSQLTYVVAVPAMAVMVEVAQQCIGV